MELYTIGVIIPGTVLEPEQAPFEQLIPLLEVPVSCVSNYPIKPFKWLRYITGVILGTEGDLLTPNGEVMDYEQTGPIHKKLSYQPNSVVKFLDPSAINHLQSSQFTTESRVEFRDAIEERDHKCVTGQFNARHCIAAHLIPHSKGNQVSLVCSSEVILHSIPILQVHTNTLRFARS
ncbi:hypothetical protein K439DRAFT_1638852 [Ramaria rubella]|nr:hypothetical protein K439DRAFT_1638852 [Ramaria rubella]